MIPVFAKPGQTLRTDFSPDRRGKDPTWLEATTHGTSRLKSHSVFFVSTFGFSADPVQYQFVYIHRAVLCVVRPCFYQSVSVIFVYIGVRS